MNIPGYRPLSRAQLDLLMAPGNDELQECWDSIAGALHSTLSMLSVSRPRPLYWDDAFNRQRLASEPARLRGTPLHEIALQNVRAAEEIERMFREQGHSPELHAIVDSYLDTLLDEFDAIRLYPEVPPPRISDEENGLAGHHRAVAGR